MPSTVTPLVREWRAIKREIDALMTVDACSAWELAGAWKGLTGDFDGTEEAFRNSVALGNTGTNEVNWMINRLNLGKFQAGQDIYARVGAPELGQFTLALREGFAAGAIAQAARFIARAEEMQIEWDMEEADDLLQAHAILLDAGIPDEQIASQLDVAGTVLRRLRIRPIIVPLATSADGLFHGVTYSLTVPVPALEAFEMNVELAEAENQAGIKKDVAFDVVFEEVRV
ncbi:hypothetical protein [Caballeronia humi]|uniref:Uncharacterized protein n=1 Tax=Caballeronia humi TaxID=326474 RepID=A0A158FRF7_9BURK|nr:hypothetical protein [Caballeronia humi]SAL22392.1 hypothetical protein AWB65_01196 [Caballeronia humi]